MFWKALSCPQDQPFCGPVCPPKLPWCNLPCPPWDPTCIKEPKYPWEFDPLTLPYVDPDILMNLQTVLGSLA